MIRGFASEGIDEFLAHITPNEAALSTPLDCYGKNVRRGRRTSHKTPQPVRQAAPGLAQQPRSWTAFHPAFRRAQPIRPRPVNDCRIGQLQAAMSGAEQRHLHRVSAHCKNGRPKGGQFGDSVGTLRRKC